MARKRTPRLSGIHATCNAFSTHEGRMLICRKSDGHTKSSDPERAAHKDPEHDHTWTDR